MKTNRLTRPIATALSAAALLVTSLYCGADNRTSTPAPPAVIANPATPPPVTTATTASLTPAAPVAAPTSAVTEDIRDIRPPYHISPGWLWLAWTVGGVALAALSYGLWRWRHRLPGLRPKLPFELALEELEAARELMQPEHARAFSIRVSEVVRLYIEVRFATRAAHRTTEEFLYDCLAETASRLSAQRELLGEFLHHCDLAKFARWVLSVPEMEAMLQSASNFVRETGVAAQAAEQLSAHSVSATKPTSLSGVAQPGAPANLDDTGNAAPTAHNIATLEPQAL